MNHKSTTVLLGTVFAVTIGIIGFNGVLSIPSGIVTTNTGAQGGVNLLGHVTVIVNGQDGEIKAYRQMDNIVTLVGRTCAAAAIFGDQPQCTSAPFQYIAIGTATQTEASSDTGLYVPTQKAIRTTYSITNSSSPNGGIATESATFGFGAPAAIAESGIGDNAGLTAQHMFARKTISPVVNVLSGDTLTVTWSVTTG